MWKGGYKVARTKTWKNTERKIAAIVGGDRVGNSGSNTEDVTHPVFSIEVKHRAALPAIITAGYGQAVRNAPEDKTPLLVIHGKGSRNYFAVLPLDVLLKMLGLPVGI